MRGYIVGLVIVAIIAIAILNTYRPDLLESWTNWLLFTR